MRGVLAGFVGTVSSRNSDFQGYWIFGQMAATVLLGLEVDLLERSPTTNLEKSIVAAYRFLVKQRFFEQLTRHRLPLQWVKRAELNLRRTNSVAEVVVNQAVSPAQLWELQASLTTDLGRTFSASQTLCVAVHDPGIELRSARRLES